MHTYVYTDIQTCRHNDIHKYIHTDIRRYICASMYACLCACTGAYLHPSIYPNVHPSMQTNKQTNETTNIRTHMHACIRTYIIPTHIQGRIGWVVYARYNAHVHIFPGAEPWEAPRHTSRRAQSAPQSDRSQAQEESSEIAAGRIWAFEP